jgi:hypothetical protein
MTRRGGGSVCVAATGLKCDEIHFTVVSWREKTNSLVERQGLLTMGNLDPT